MQRVTRSTAVAVAPLPPASPGTPGYFAKPDPVAGVPATVPGYEWFNGVQEELIALILGAGLTPAPDNLAQILAAVRLLASGNEQVFVASGAAVAPAWARRAFVEVWGGGGSGGAGSGALGAASGAGAGEYRRGVVAVTAGASYPVTVGGGGAPSTGFANGNPGGTSSFGSLISASGGGAGNGANGALHGAGGSGGASGAGGGLNISGQGGGGAYQSGSSVAGGSGGASYGGSIPGPSIMTAGIAGRYPGGGGSGGANSNSGGAGASGLCIVRWLP